MGAREGFVPGGTKGKRGPRTDNRRFLDALLWMARSGGRWKDLPERLGDYRTVKRRYYDWVARGVLDQMLEALARDRLEWLMIDSTIVRAHQHAAGRARSKGADAQGLGRSRGGLSTKIHARAMRWAIQCAFWRALASATTSRWPMT